MNRFSIVLPATLLVISLTFAWAGASPTSREVNQTFLVMFQGTAIPAGIAEKIARAGGTMTGTCAEIGVITAVSSKSAFVSQASQISGVRSVVPDISVRWTPSPVEMSGIPALESSIGSDEGFFAYQWGPVAISAPSAWDIGARGTGVRVAIVDGGISSNHVDIQPNLDAAASKSFVPGQPYNFDTGTFWHATHVAGIVAAADNAIGVIGIAPKATLIGVKVLHNGSGSFSQIDAGIVYAAGVANAQIINLSLGATFPRSGFWSDPGTPDDPSDDVWVSARDLSELIVALQRSLNYAYQQGATIIVSAGNDALDADHTANLLVIPAMLEHVIAVSATGPTDFAHGGNAYDMPASYTNYGQSLITFAAPGGDSRLYPNGLWYYDMVLSCSYVSGTSNFYTWASGTSMAAPHVAGVAALVIEANGGSMPPAQVQAVLGQSADDLGKPGKDDFYGLGRVNAYKAVLAARGTSASLRVAPGAEMNVADELPVETKLFQNYPNPFNPKTEIRYQVSVGSNVDLKVYDILGRTVATLVNEWRKPGTYKDAFDGSALPSGMYLYRLTAGGFVATGRMILVK